MALVQDSTGKFLDSATGQYFEPYTAPMAAPQRGYMSMSGFVPLPSFRGMPQQSNIPKSSNPEIEALRNVFRLDSTPQGLIGSDGQSFRPFTGDAEGISQGKKSVVDNLVGKRQPYQYNVPSLAELFPSLLSMTPNLQEGMLAPNMQNNVDPNALADGLLSPRPEPISSETIRMLSSGVGRFL